MQKEFQGNEAPNPRGYTIKRLLKALKKEKETAKDKRLEDRGKGTMEDCISEREFLDIGLFFYMKTPAGEEVKIQREKQINQGVNQ